MKSSDCWRPLDQDTRDSRYDWGLRRVDAALMRTTVFAVIGLMSVLWSRPRFPTDHTCSSVAMRGRRDGFHYNYTSTTSGA